MNHSREGRAWRHGASEIGDADDPASRFVFGPVWILLAVGTLLVAEPWAGFHGVLLACMGLVMLLRPPLVALPRRWWLLAAGCGVAAAAAFLPVGWFVQPEWRRRLADLGIETGPLVVIQARQALEALGWFAIVLLGGLWLAGQRASSVQVRRWALAFTLGVAAYAILARVMQDTAHGGHPAADAHFGFFPNRNHTATYLAMGAVCGLGNVFQALRDKRFVRMAVALVATGVCLWAVAAWSVSRAGVVLVAVGCVVWVPMLGTRYLGKHGLRALGLIGLAAGGLFFITDSVVKERFTKTVEKASVVIKPTSPALAEGEKPAMDSAHDLDFRVPTVLDTLDLIRDFKWTGVGAAQYYYVFPQYRKLTSVANGADSYHPESDWLWLAAETGVPATLLLAGLVGLAFWKARGAVLSGRDRALRSACLVAALLVPIHGLFDVPGHRITLAWSAAFLFALALHAPSREALATAPRVWPSRCAALLVLLVAGWLVLAQWWGGPQPALTAATTALQQAHDLYQEDRVLQQEAQSKGLAYQPSPDQDRLEKALAILAQAAPHAPLDRGLLRYQGFLAMHFDDKYALADRSFALELALDPTWVEGPLRQAQAWAPSDPQRCAALWSEALRRAAQLDRQHPGNEWSGEQTLQRIRQFAKDKPALEKLVPLPP